MIGRTHDIAAFGSLVIAASLMEPRPLRFATVVAVFIANQIGGVAPDIDQPTAPLWRLLPITGFIGRYADNVLGGHRGLSHSILGLGLFGFVVNWLLIFFQPLFPSVEIHLVCLAFMIGMVSHLIMDTFTKDGVRWLLPVPIKIGIPPLKTWRITTGSWVENFITTPLLVVISLWLIYAHYDHFLDIFSSLKR